MMLVLIIPHEFGHFIAAKLCNVKVNEFSVGMGPLLFKRQRGETQYSVRLLPLGGFCAMEGEDEGSDDPRSYSSKTDLQKTFILLAGVTMNIIIAVLVVTIAFAAAGVPVNRIGDVEPGMPAASAGLKAGDTILSIDGTRTEDWTAVTDAISTHDEGEMEIVYRRDGREASVRLLPEHDSEQNRYVIGITAASSRNPALCLSYGARTTWNMNRMMLTAFASMFRNGIGSDDVAGPVGLVRVVNRTASYGAESYLMLLALVSLNLALFNILPIPGLDGGKVFFIILKKISRGRITDDMETKATVAGMMLLIALVIVITVNDVRNIFG